MEGEIKRNKKREGVGERKEHDGRIVFVGTLRLGEKHERSLEIFQNVSKVVRKEMKVLKIRRQNRRNDDVREPIYKSLQTLSPPLLLVRISLNITYPTIVFPVSILSFILFTNERFSPL